MKKLIFLIIVCALSFKLSALPNTNNLESADENINQTTVLKWSKNLSLQKLMWTVPEGLKDFLQLTKKLRNDAPVLSLALQEEVSLMEFNFLEDSTGTEYNILNKAQIDQTEYYLREVIGKICSRILDPGSPKQRDCVLVNSTLLYQDYFKKNIPYEQVAEKMTFDELLNAEHIDENGNLDDSKYLTYQVSVQKLEEVTQYFKKYLQQKVQPQAEYFRKECESVSKTENFIKNFKSADYHFLYDETHIEYLHDFSGNGKISQTFFPIELRMRKLFSTIDTLLGRAYDQMGNINCNFADINQTLVIQIQKDLSKLTPIILAERILKHRDLIEIGEIHSKRYDDFARALRKSYNGNFNCEPWEYSPGQ